MTQHIVICTAWSKINTAKFGEGSSVMAVWLCIGCPRLVGRRKAGNSNMQELFCSTLYDHIQRESPNKLTQKISNPHRNPSHHQKQSKFPLSVEAEDGDVAVRAAGNQPALVRPDVPDGLPVVAQGRLAQPRGVIPYL